MVLGGIEKLLVPLVEFSREIANNPNYAEAYAYLGDIALRRNDLTTATENLTKALQIQASIRLAQYDLGSVYASLNRNEEAAAALKRAIALDPGQPDAHWKLARVYQAMGKQAEAKAELAETTKIHRKQDDETLLRKIPGEPSAAVR